MLEFSGRSAGWKGRGRVEDVCASLKEMFLLARPLMALAERARIDVLYLILSNAANGKPLLYQTAVEQESLFLSKSFHEAYQQSLPEFPLTPTCSNNTRT